MDYRLVEWPGVQELMRQPWFRKECFLYQAFDDQPYRDSAYFVPLTRLREVELAANRELCAAQSGVPVELLPDAQRRQLLANGTNRDQGHAPIVRLFVPEARAQWLLSEIDPDDPDIAFGLCDLGLGCPELGSVSLSEIASVIAQTGLPVNWDPSFEPYYPMSVYARAARIAGEITLDARLLELAVEDGSTGTKRGPKGPQP